MASEALDGPVVGDAFGQLLLECLEAGIPTGEFYEVVERNDGRISVGDAARYFRPDEAWNDLEQWALEKVSGEVLDIGAGAGRHALYLQDKGMEVTALDLSPGAVEVCQRRGIKRTILGTIDRASKNEYDTFLLMGNNLGLLENDVKAPLFLAKLATLSKPGAMVIGTGLDPVMTTNPLHLQYHERNRSRGRMPGHTTLRVRYERTVTPWFDYLFASTMEIEKLLAGSGWTIEDRRENGASYALVLRKTS
jgi:SAM-dependent methyltransferase